jgi:hypothetical protein
MRPVLIALALLTAVAGPASAQDDRRWNFHEDEEGLSLSWAIPDSDDSGPFFYCQRGEGKVGVVLFVRRRLAVGEPNAQGQWLNARGEAAPWPGVLSLSSGKVTTSAQGGVVNDEMDGGSMIEAKLPPGSPVLAEFARTGRIRLMAFGETANLAGAPLAAVRALIQDCGK